MQWEAELRQAEEAARQAGALLREAFLQKPEILEEPGHDIKLQADQDAERIILDALAASTYPLLAEESGAHGLRETENETFWVVDPLDGTMNFSRQLPQCAVSIGLNQGEHAQLGVIYDFNRDELYTGVVGEGAWLNGAPMAVSGVSERGRAMLSTAFPRNLARNEAGVHDFCQQINGFRKTRMLGSTALSLAYIACGRMDAFADDDIMLWDIAGGLALIEAAGGYIETGPASSKWSRRARCAAHRSIWHS